MNNSLTWSSSQAARLQTDVDRVTEMLGEIHEWFVDNLKSKAAVPRTSATPAPGEADPLSSTSIRFQIFESSGQQLTLICPEASLSQKSAKAGNHDSHDSRSLFTCCCPASTGAANHRQTVEAYGCRYSIALNKYSKLTYELDKYLLSALLR